MGSGIWPDPEHAYQELMERKATRRRRMVRRAGAVAGACALLGAAVFVLEIRSPAPTHRISTGTAPATMTPSGPAAPVLPLATPSPRPAAILPLPTPILSAPGLFLPVPLVSPTAVAPRVGSAASPLTAVTGTAGTPAPSPTGGAVPPFDHVMPSPGLKP